MIKKIYFISGVSGVGKTSTLKYLKDSLDSNFYDVRDLDERGVPDGGGLDWLNNETRHWLDVANDNAQKGKSTIVCGFANPELFGQVYKKDIDIPAQIILLNASAGTIRARLEGRHNTPETVKEIERASGVSLNQFIENNTSFSVDFKNIFEKSKLPIIETDNKNPQEVVSEIVSIIKNLHKMELKLDPFLKIRNGIKTIEIRLDDEKRQGVRVGDTIEFSLFSDHSQKIIVVVKDLYYFNTFKELFCAFAPREYGGENMEEYTEMYNYYSKEDEEKFGVLGIRVKVL